MTAALHWLPLAQRILCCEWVDRRGRDGWCETHDDPWPCGRAQEAADMLAEELDQPTKEQKMSNDTPTPIDPADIRPGDVVERRDRITVHSLEHGAWMGAVPGFYSEYAGFFPWSIAEGLRKDVTRTWHLVSRPDPDAEAVEAMAVAEGSITGPGIWQGIWQWRDFLTQLREQGWDVVRRAES